MALGFNLGQIWSILKQKSDEEMKDLLFNFKNESEFIVLDNLYGSVSLK